MSLLKKQVRAKSEAKRVLACANVRSLGDEKGELVDLPNGFASLFADGASSEGFREDSML